MVGTVAYMAPERFDTDRDGTAVGPAADVFAWGAVVAYAASGRTPFQADSAAATAARILTQPPDLSGLPDPLRRVVGRTLAKDPKDRPTAHELLEMLLDLDSADTTRTIGPEVRKAAQAVRRPRSRRRALIAAVVVLAVGLAGAFTVRSVPQVRAAFSASPETKGPETTVASSAPSQAAPKRPAVAGPSVIDRLDRPGQWKLTSDDSDSGKCVFARDRFEVTTQGSSVYRCDGPADTFAGDQSIAVDATILSAGACAEIWFRSVTDGAYRVSVCEKDVRIGVDSADDIADEVKAAVTPVPLGQSRKIRVEVRDEQASVVVDGTSMITLKLGEPALAAGRVEFGGLNDADSGDSRAAFANAEIRTAKSGTTTFPDLTLGSTKSVVKLYAYDARSRSVVVEPILFMTGEQYCKTFKLKTTDARCNREWITEESHTKVTVPVAAKPKYFTWEDDNGDVCIDTPEAGGTCPMTAKAFGAWAADNAGAMVAVTTADATITRMAQIYTP
jgi:hypothetical protein